LLKTTPVLNFTSRLPRRRQRIDGCFPPHAGDSQKIFGSGSLSRNGCVSVPFSPGKDGPYHPIPEEMITALHYSHFLLRLLQGGDYPRVLLSTKIFFLFDVQRLSANSGAGKVDNIFRSF
jgi:hypothetical protein